MAFTNYQDLQDAVASWLNREDQEVTDRIPDFIVFGENAIFRRLRSRFNETTLLYDADLIDNSAGITLPDDFKEVKLVKYNGYALTRRSEQWDATIYKGTVPNDTPVYFYREGNQLKWDANGNADVELIYYNQQLRVSDGTTVPTLYLDYPELYLFGALHEARAFLKATDAQTIAAWSAKFDELVGEVQLESDMAEYAGSTVSVANAYPEEIRTRENYVR